MKIKTDCWARLEPTRTEAQALNTTEQVLNVLLKIVNKDMYVHDIKGQRSFSYHDIQTALQLLDALSGANQLQIDTEKGE